MSDKLGRRFYAESPLTMDATKGPDEQYIAGAVDMLTVIVNALRERSEEMLLTPAYENGGFPSRREIRQESEQVLSDMYFIEREFGAEK